ncbi:MAG: helicase-exonuclease AddAB subunit AddB [Gracilibacter sp. BRH_c7a]|nr:MAG: helicase-exonuclease AddAB subunit AddB [Gracilibacter sp. BRH_c7a]
MSIRIIYGRAGSGKTHFCLNEIQLRISSGITHPLVLLVPEQFTLQAERDLIRVLGTGGILETEVLSFRRLAFRIFSQEGGITYPHIHSAGKCMIIYRVLDKIKNNLKVFAKSADRQGFVNTLATLISEFKRYSISPSLLEEVSRNIEEDNQLKDKMKELNAIYVEFERIVAQRYRDSDDDLTIVSDKLSNCDLYDNAEIWIDGFNGFTPQEFRVISKLLTKTQRVNISLCTDSLEYKGEEEVFSSVKNTYHKIIKIAQETGSKIEKPIFLGGQPLFRFDSSPELAHLEQNLYAYPHKTFAFQTKDISLFSSINIFAEIEATARDILRLCRDRGMRYRDIAVVTRDLPNYERLIEVIFTEYNIPFFMDRKVDITNHPLVRLILSMLDIFKENWSYEAVFRYLKTGLTGLERASIDKLENYVLACGIRGSRWTKEENWDMSTNLLPEENDFEKSEDVLQELNCIREAVSSPLLEFRQRTKGRRKASEICTALYDFLCYIEVPARIEDLIKQFQLSGELSLANEYSQVWNTLMDVLDQTVEVMGDETLGLERFADILEIGLREYKIGLIPASLDQVLVGSVERSRSHELKALYLLGVNDGVFPSSDLEEGILSDLDRQTLNRAGIELAGDTRAQAFDEQYLVYRTLATAGNYLRLSWPIGDHEGRSMRPSIIISRLKKLFPKITENSNILKTDESAIELISSRSPAFRQMVSEIRSKADGGDMESLWQEVYRWFMSQQDWQDIFQAVRSAFLYKNIAQSVNQEKMELLYGSPAYASVSRLERYKACPFAFYVQYGLGAKERTIYCLNPPDIGTFMHKVIEKFSLYISEQNISWRELDKDWCKEKVSDIVDELLAKMRGAGLAGSQRYTALTVRLKRVVSRAVWLIAEHIKRSSFEPLGYELGFGESEQFPPIMIELDSGTKINLVGRIDRVDTLETEEGTYLRIVDYKSGGKDLKLSDVYYGLQIQLLTYLDAITQNGEMNLTSPILPGGVLYFRIDDPIIRRNSKIPEEEIEIAIMKQLKMKGLLLADVKLIREMDRSLQGPSSIIPATINQGDVLGKASKVASLTQFKMLHNYVRKLLKDLGEEIMQGNVAIKPYKKKGITSCTYCNYSAVCQFDPALKENNYQSLRDQKDEDIWKLIAENGGEQ